MPGLFETADEPREIPQIVAEHRSRKREWLVSLLISLGCHICPAQAGESCDLTHDDDELIVQVDRHPPVYVHVPRIARVIARRPTIRRLVLAQFEDGQAPEELTRGTT